MKAGREAVSNALFEQLQKCVGDGANQYPFATFERQPLSEGQLNTALKPAAFLFKLGETWDQQQAYGAIRYLVHYILLIYVDASPASDVIGESTANEILDSIDYWLQAQPFAGPQTLGNIVEQAYVNGEVWIDLNILSNKMSMGVPITVKTAL